MADTTPAVLVTVDNHVRLHHEAAWSAADSWAWWKRDERASTYRTILASAQANCDLCNPRCSECGTRRSHQPQRALRSSEGSSRG